ncbi:hypothetical protein GDO81_020253 [Engystomops pustulosus]|uniref:Uncharacterized protein n=1 Tax=Engystomops pustulosus TaxID=76066 RepID=A0AAV6Z1K7_ENGPU|nr:hypothetical protein GDO81_020253 [Engystomops pustulosus]
MLPLFEVPSVGNCCWRLGTSHGGQCSCLSRSFHYGTADGDWEPHVEDNGPAHRGPIIREQLLETGDLTWTMSQLIEVPLLGNGCWRLGTSRGGQWPISSRSYH